MKLFLLSLIFLFSVETSTYHIKFEGGKAKHEYGYYVTLKAGWYEYLYDDSIYSYFLFEKDTYKVYKSYKRIKRIKVKRYNNYYED